MTFGRSPGTSGFGSARRQRAARPVSDADQAQLVDGASGAHLWADKFDGFVKDVFDVQYRITESVVVVSEPHIRQAEIERSRRKPPENPRCLRSLP